MEPPDRTLNSAVSIARAGMNAAVLVVLFATGARTGLAQPVVAPGGVTNGASFSSPVVAGGAASIFGSNLASSTMSYGNVQPVPKSLAGTSVQIGGFAAAEYFVSTGQINVQIPWELAGQTQAFLTVTTAAGISVPVAVDLIPQAPALFSASANGMGQGWIFSPNNTLNSATTPSFPHGIVHIGATDLGAVTHRPGDGFPPSSATPSNTRGRVSVDIGGLSAVVMAAQLCGPTVICPMPDSSYLLTVEVPASVAGGSAIPVVASMGGISSNTVTMAIALPGVTKVQIPGLGCTTAYGTDTFAVSSWSYRIGAYGRGSVEVTKASDDCTSSLFERIPSDRLLTSVTVTQYDTSGTQDIHIQEIVDLQHVRVSSGTFGGSVSFGPMDSSIFFSAESIAIH